MLKCHDEESDRPTKNPFVKFYQINQTTFPQYNSKPIEKHINISISIPKQTPQYKKSKLQETNFLNIDNTYNNICNKKIVPK